MAQQNDSQVTNSGTQSPSDSVNASSISDPPKDQGADMAAPYGTRSRNRGGRVNYAEDKDIDTDVYDYYDKKDQEGSKKPARKSDAGTNGDTTLRPVGSRRAAAEEAKAANASSQNGVRDTTLGIVAGASQSTQAPGATQGTRKRKAAVAAAAATAQAAAATAAGTAATASATAVSTATGASTKRNGQVVHAAATSWPDTNMLTFENCGQRMDGDKRMVADDGTVLEANDHVYLVCEPPGEPYYLGRIMEFLHSHSERVDAVRINWFYRPKDIGRKTPDTRLVFATMHSDVSPLTALRGKCQIRHRVEIDDLDAYRKTPDCFWYEKLYDRYIQKNYDLLPTSTIVNVPDKVKKVLDERWKFVLVEQGRGKELTSAVKLCKRCTGYCASNDSVDCAVCQNTYHMNCVKPPLLKKPSRGFAWSCAACSRAQERKLEARDTPNGADAEDDDLLDDDDDDMRGIETDRNTPAENEEHHKGTAEQIYQASLWPWRYLGMHCKPEDALDYDDRIHPRASTRIGPRHQANVGAWPGCPVQYVKPIETRKGRGAPKLSREAQVAQEERKAARHNRPKWVQDEPPGYQTRGEDLNDDDPNATSARLWISPPENPEGNHEVVDYMVKARGLAKKLSLPDLSTNLQDVALETLLRDEYDAASALKGLLHIDRKFFKEPTLTPAEQKKFEEGVAKYGSELHLVMKHVKSMTPGEVVRYYYTWKKTERGKQVWGSYSGRKGKRFAKKEDTAASKAADDVADNDDDSAFDTKKALEKKRNFICQFCSTTTSRQWRRAPTTQSLVNESGAKATSKDKGSHYVVALCRRCAELWRRYAIRWEDMDEVAKKVTQSGGKAWKRKQDEELLKELQAAQEMGVLTPDRDSTPAAPSNGQEPPRKKLKGAPEKDPDVMISDAGSTVTAPRKKDKTADSTPVPDMPKPRILPCAICDQMEPLGDQHLSCRECRLTVHRNCYGVMDNRVQGKWICDMCSNDKSPQVSIHYKCVLCPVEYTEQDFVEQPKLTHHKKKMSEKDREKERLEVQQARKAAEYYRKRQEDLNRPVNPREALKRTAENNWVHVTCAVWTPEVKFENARAMEPSEGVPSIPRAKYEEVCQACTQRGGACISCHQCRVPYHVECARQQGHLLGFDISPVKSSRRDQFNIVTINGESGIMSAALWCKDHIPTKTVAHKMHDVVDDSGLNALQLYVRSYKKADFTMAGTVRKANLMMTASKTSGLPLPPGARRASTTTTTTTTTATTTALANGASSHIRASEPAEAGPVVKQTGTKVCITCGTDVTPKWWPTDTTQERRLTNGHHGSIGFEAQKFVEQRRFQCHQCKKHPEAAKSRDTRPVSPVAAENVRQYVSGPSPAAPPQSVTTVVAAAAAAAAAEAPGQSPRSAPVDYRPASLRPELHSLLHHHTSSHGSAPHVTGPPPPPPPPQQQQKQQQSPPVPSPNHPPRSGSHTMGPRPAASVAHGYLQAQTRTAPSDWGSRHGSPPRLVNGAPLSLHGNRTPPMSNMSVLRPPSMSGPPPPAVAPISAPHQHSHGSPVYGNALPISPRRLNGPPPPPSAGYVPPFATPQGSVHTSIPRHSASPGVSSVALPPRTEPFSHGLHPQRSPFTSSSHSSPPVTRGLISPHGAPPPPPLAAQKQDTPSPLGQRPPESRPASGASASPSLRNLLS